MIIAYLIYDSYSLRACTLTCYSWYIAAVPHLHHTFAIIFVPWCLNLWPLYFLRSMHVLGLLPLFKDLRIHVEEHLYHGLSAERFDRSILRYFLALTNVRNLRLDYLDIPSFMARVQQYFGHFFPTVESLTLKTPKGSYRQIVYFIGLFQHLEDLELICDPAGPRQDQPGDLTLVPPFTPPLRGWLKVQCFTEVELLKVMIGLFGGIQFRGVDLSAVQEVQLLLDACAKTLETLILRPIEARGKQRHLGCGF